MSSIADARGTHVRPLLVCFAAAVAFVVAVAPLADAATDHAGRASGPKVEESTTSEQYGDSAASADEAADTDLTVGDRAGFAPGAEFLHLPDRAQVAELDAIQASGAKWFRVGVQWSQVETERGEPHWKNVDHVLRLVLERDLEPIVMIGYTPAWARASDCYSQYCPPADDATYAEFVRTVVERYAPYGVSTYEIWNEPNLVNFWRPAPDPARYTSLLRAAAAAARSVDPAVTVLSGGLSPAANDLELKTTPATFLEQMYRNGAAGSFDGMGMHPYAYPVAPMHPRPWNAFYTLPVLHEIMEANGDGHKRIWMTEFGYSTGAWKGATSLEDQARYLTEAYEVIAEAPWAGPLIWFNYRDRGTDPNARELNFGLVTWTGEPKPALAAFEKVAGQKLR